jgi:signal peptidase II
VFSSTPPSVPGTPGSTTRIDNRILWLIPAILVILDQITKWAIRANLEIHESVPVLGDWLRFTYIRNPGGAFGLRWGHDLVYFVSACIVIGWIIWQIVRHGHTRRLSIWALALILGGAVGNLTDRIAFGEVTDFIDAEFFDLYVPAFDFGVISHPGYTLERWPAFNIADSSITVGLVALLVTLWYDPRLGREQETPMVETAPNRTSDPPAIPPETGISESGFSKSE